MSPRAGAVAVLLAGLSVFGCDRQATLPTAVSPPTTRPDAATRAIRAPRAESGRGFYPLEVGNRWTYRGWQSSTLTPPQGDPITKRSSWTRSVVLAGFESRNGRQYVRRETTLEDEAQTTHWVAWMRQDRTGLYELGTPPPVRDPAADPGQGERRLLAYPIHVGARWAVDAPMRVLAEVERREPLDTPAGRFAAWRVRIRNGGHAPGEESLAWYGRAGYLGMRERLRFERPDGSGGRWLVSVDRAEWLTAAELGDGPPCRAVVAEARQALGGVLTGEQVYYQKYATFIAAADNGEIAAKLGVVLGESGLRWDFSVSDVSATGFIATARGRARTEAEGIVLGLRYVRNAPLEWKVEGCPSRVLRDIESEDGER